jgi:DNA-directed RNA polymerase subunit M/transcription elongation factor TFIIS
MKKNTVLKKEFKQRDVERMRNLIQGKYGDKTVAGVGYSKPKEFHEEGDVWTEDGRTWTIQNGIKQNVTKLAKAKEGIVLPLFCPSCSNAMKPHLDKKWFVMYGHCFNCQVDFEANLKKTNSLETFEKNIINQHIEGTIEDFTLWFDELLNEKNEFITEAGDIEKWDGTGKEQLLRYKKEALEFLEKQKK